MDMTVTGIGSVVVAQLDFVTVVDAEKAVTAGTLSDALCINNIIFSTKGKGGEGGASAARICTELKIYGMPDRIRPPPTLGLLLLDEDSLGYVTPGVYKYWLALELEQKGKSEMMYLSTVEEPSIRVLYSVSGARRTPG